MALASMIPAADEANAFDGRQQYDCIKNSDLESDSEIELDLEIKRYRLGPISLL